VSRRREAPTHWAQPNPLQKQAKAKKIKCQRHYGRRIPQATSTVQPRSRPTPDATKKSNNFHPKSPTSKSDHSNHPNENKTTGERPTDTQKGSQFKRLKGGDKFPTSYSEEGKETTVEFKG